MVEELIQAFDTDVFCEFINDKFSGSFAPLREEIPVDEKFPWASAEQVGIVKSLPGENGLNMPLAIVVAKLPEGEEMKERSSRVKQFRFAKQTLDEAMATPRSNIEGVVSQGLFAFYDENGNFRLSLIHGEPKGTKLVWSGMKRFSFYVEAGQPNKTFRERAALPWSPFNKLKDAFSVEKLTKEFYNRLFDWYQRAMDSNEVVFPNDVVKDKEPGEVKSEQIIRLITRLMFVWFLKQKKLVPDQIFDPEALKDILQDFSPVSGENYYRAILQNLFFATLNSEIDERGFAVDGGKKSVNREHFDIKTLYRYSTEFALSQEQVLDLFRQIPFLNGGLFECLDRGQKYYDGFSREPAKQAKVTNRLFFDTNNGLLPLLKRYNFTVEENSPGDEEVALDPELLGKVFENLLAAYNPETNVQARKATGSFYTPREIVSYMVDESLIAHLITTCGDEHEDTIRQLFNDGERPTDENLCKSLSNALKGVQVLDPACGSGAFPMGILRRMVDVLRVLECIPDEDSERIYNLKLELIENAIYGADIQCIAVQISKLRFFISLVCEQEKTDDPDVNYGIHTLPNLETKFVAADSLIGLPENSNKLPVPEIEQLKNELWTVRHKHFTARSYRQKKELRKNDKKLRHQLATALQESGGFDTDSAELMAEWDPYDQNTSASYLDPEWMFNVKDGFDVVIGNPPYGFRNVLSAKKKKYFRKVEGIHFPSGDIAELFIIKSLHRFVKPEGCLTFIIPKKSLYGESWRNVRGLWQQNCLRSLMDASQAFENVLLEQTAFVLTKIESVSNHVRIGCLDNIGDSINVFGAFVKQDIFSSRGCAQIYRGMYPQSLCQKINELSVNDSSKLLQAHIGISNITSHLTFEAEGNYPCLKGIDIQRYGIKKRERYLEASVAEKYVSEHTHNKLIAQEIIAHIEHPKPHISIAAFWDEQGRLFNDTCVEIRILGEGLEPLFMLAYIQSKFVAWYAYNFIYNRAIRTMHFINYYVTQIPIPEKTLHRQDLQQPFVELSRNILDIKKANPGADVSALESEIDHLVYNLYGLTDEEIAIVEESVGSGADGSGKGLKTDHDKADDGAKSSASKKTGHGKQPKPHLPPSLPGWD